MLYIVLIVFACFGQFGHVQDVFFSHFMLGTTPPELGPFEALCLSLLSECAWAEKNSELKLRQNYVKLLVS